MRNEILFIFQVSSKLHGIEKSVTKKLYIIDFFYVRCYLTNQKKSFEHIQLNFVPPALRVYVNYFVS